MISTTPCPDAETLHAFAVGQSPESVAHEMEAHLAACPRCLAVLSAADHLDPLIDAVRAGAAVPEDSEDGRWVERFRQLADELSRSAVTPPAGDAHDTLDHRPASRVDAPTEALYGVLAPPTGPGEIGWLGPYRVLGALGEGGMGVVFRAEDPALARPLALKVMLPRAAATPGAKDRFLREARAAAAIKHDHVVTIYQVSEDRGVPFIAMELLVGESLADRLNRVGRLPAAEAVRIARQAAEGLAAAHARGMVHRDVKPGNLWLEAPTDRVKVVDFGLVRGTTTDGESTNSGVILGTPAYMAPEQAQSGRTVDARADLFSLGCVLYRALTGKSAFSGRDTITTLMSVATETPPAPHKVVPELPRDLSHLVMRLLAKDPAGRPASATVLVDELIGLERMLAAPAPVKRRPRWVAPVAVVAVLLGTVLALFAPTIIRFVTNKGELIVEVHDPKLEVVVKDGKAEFRDAGGDRERRFVIEAGNGEVEFYKVGSTVRLSAVEFRVVRGGRLVLNARTVRVPDRIEPAVPIPVVEPVALPSVPEPPPLAEWLKGRTELTVARDGKGQFKTIQAALDALKPGQVVRVLDAGPYRERLWRLDIPRDCGLVSDVRTAIELPDDDASWMRNDPANASYGHRLVVLEGAFRLHGFAFTFPPRADGQGLAITTRAGFVMENCRLRLPPTEHDQARAAMIVSLPAAESATPSVIRECKIDGRLGFQAMDGHIGSSAGAVVVRNYFSEEAENHRFPFFVQINWMFRKVVIRANVFDKPTESCVSLWNIGRVGEIDVSHNTFRGPARIKFDGDAAARVVPRGRVRVVGNLFTAPGQITVKERIEPEVYRQWEVGRNTFHPDSPISTIPHTATDRVARVQFLSYSPSHPDYLRLPADTPSAGALPPGPAPKDGDWFTRLRERWGDTKPVTAPIASSEPPPLAEWLKGRTVLTVSQDGKGQYKTIQSAIDALKPGQVVKVLDAGPYRERLRQLFLPPDCGLVSEVRTVIDLPDSPSMWDRTDDGNASVAHLLSCEGPFRLHGFALTFPPREDGQGLAIIPYDELVVENCRFRMPGATHTFNRALRITTRTPRDRNPTILVRENWIDGQVAFDPQSSPNAEVRLTRNFFHVRPGGTFFAQTYNSFRSIAVRHNVFVANRPLPVSIYHGEKSGRVEVARNTFPNGGYLVVDGHDGPDKVRQASLQGDVHFVGNLFGGEGLLLGPPGFPADTVRPWHTGRNAFPQKDARNLLFVGKEGETNRVERPRFLSRKPADRDYLRVPADSPADLGALPPGPAPTDGDWFTRLRERWSDVPLPPTPVVPIPDPQPLAEWRKGRTELTVSQDGKGQFKTIQAAFDAVKSGQVIRVLDRGPYRETLKVNRPPQDIGLVSDARTVVEVTTWTNETVGSSEQKFVYRRGHQINNLSGFRLSGFRFASVLTPGDHVNVPVGLGYGRAIVVEDCAFVSTDVGGTSRTLSLSFDSFAAEDGTAPVVVQDCRFDGGELSVTADGAPHNPPVLIQRNWCRPRGRYDSGVQMQSAHRKIVVRHNVVTAARNGGFTFPLTETAFLEGLSVHNNTIVGNGIGGNRIYLTAPEVVSIRNNIGPPFTLSNGAEASRAAVKRWDVSRNCYTFRPEASLDADVLVFRRPGDLPDGPTFLSTNPADRDYLRVAATAPEATSGVGGSLPAYVGALPPGSAPKDGDWFTRLRERWPDAPPAKP